MSSRCRHCTNFAQISGDRILCEKCTINEFKKFRNVRCASGRDCVHKRPDTRVREWQLPSERNYRVNRDGTLHLYPYCHQCYMRWRAQPDDKFEQLKYDYDMLLKRYEQVQWEKQQIEEKCRQFEIRCRSLEIRCSRIDSNVQPPELIKPPRKRQRTEMSILDLLRNIQQQQLLRNIHQKLQ